MPVNTSSHKLKVDQKCLGWTWSKMGMGSMVTEIVSQEWIDGMNWHFACWCKFRKTKIYFNDFWVGVVKNCHGYIVCEALKSVVSKEWVYELSCFFECWLWSSNFWLGQHGFLYLWLLNTSLLQLYLLDP